MLPAPSQKMLDVNARLRSPEEIETRTMHTFENSTQRSQYELNCDIFYRFASEHAFGEENEQIRKPLLKKPVWARL